MPNAVVAINQSTWNSDQVTNSYWSHPNARITSGVIAFNHRASLASNYQSLTTALKPQLNSTCN